MCLFIYVSTGNETSVTPLCLCPPFSSLSSCSQKSRCERADEPYRFAASLNQCVKATVYPDSIAVSEPSVPVSVHIYVSAYSKHTHSHSKYQTHSISTTTCTHKNEKFSPIYIFTTHVQRQKILNDPT